MTTASTFSELTYANLKEIDGGFVLTATLFTFLGVAVTGTMCVKAGAALGLAVAGIIVLSA